MTPHSDVHVRVNVYLNLPIVKLPLKTSFLDLRYVNEHAEICDAVLTLRETAGDVAKELSEIGKSTQVKLTVPSLVLRP